MGVELHDDKGLICGFRLRPGQRLDPIQIGDVDAENPSSTPLWLHFNFNDTRARNWIAACAWLTPEGREALLSSDATVRLDRIGDAVVGTLADAYADDPDAFGVFHIYVDAHCLITTRRHPTMAGLTMRQQIADGLVVGTPSALFNRLLASVVAALEKMVAQYVDLIDTAEDHVFAGEIHQKNIGQYRRAMARVRRHVTADRHALQALAEQVPPWWDNQTVQELSKLTASVVTIGGDLELAEERARLVTEEIDSRLTAITNRNLYFISLAAALFLPITVISGIFGMNVGGLPFTETENGFMYTVAVMVATIVIGFALIFWRRMF